jgi:chromosome segregation ATPase
MNHIFTHVVRRSLSDAPGTSLRIKLAAPGRVTSKPVQDAIVNLGEMNAKQRDLFALQAKVEVELESAKLAVKAAADAKLDGKKVDLDALIARKKELKREVESGQELTPRMQQKVNQAVSGLVAAWRADRAPWSKKLDQEARDTAVRLVSLATDLARLTEDFELSLGTLAGYAINEADPSKNVASIAPHVLTNDLGAARAALGSAITKLTERKLI